MEKLPIKIAPNIIEILESSPDGRTKNELSMLSGASHVTVQRALVYLRGLGVPIYFLRFRGKWYIEYIDEYEDDSFGNLTLDKLIKEGVISRGQAIMLGYEYAKPR